MDQLTHGQALRLAWPIILANAAGPLLGLVDTAVIGHVGGAADLGAIALGALLFNFVFWGFGFLRMGTTGFVAQADGAGDEEEVRASLGRALLLGLLGGVLLLLLQSGLGWLAFSLFLASAEVEAIAAQYFAIRIWSAPAVLASYALIGLLIGLGETRRVMVIQLFLNGTNIVLDVLFAAVLGWGVAGVAAGTLIAEILSCGLAVVLVARLLLRRHEGRSPFLPWHLIRRADRLRQMLVANRDIMLRTLLMLFGFAWFTNAGARFGDAVLAANHVLLLFISFSAFFLDGFAHVAESFVGRALGAGRRAAFDRAVRVTSELAAVNALMLGVAFALFGTAAISAITDLPEVAELARRHLPMAVVYIVISFAAFQLDGIYIGATWSRTLRNASALSVAVFLLVSLPLMSAHANHGLWLAFLIYIAARALSLLLPLPALRRAGFG